MNILNNIIEKSNGFYVHALEVEDLNQLESIVENLVDEFKDKYNQDEIIEFFESMAIYSLSDENEDEINDFNFEKFIKEI